MLIITFVLTLGICIGWLRFRIDDSTDLCKSVGPGTEDTPMTYVPELGFLPGSNLASLNWLVALTPTGVPQIGKAVDDGVYVSQRYPTVKQGASVSASYRYYR